jgi:protein-S-isoprenylcysteine O-methyltransferase Ste14
MTTVAELKSETARILAPPPVLAVICMAAGYGLERLRPTTLIARSGFAAIWLSFAAFGVAAVLFLWSFLVLKKHRTPVDPYKPTRALVTTGPYRFSRNPLYLALLLVVLGFAVTRNSVWLALATVALLPLLHFGVIRREERYLQAKFGAEYNEYRARVRRWL